VRGTVRLEKTAAGLTITAADTVVGPTVVCEAVEL
jgi:hypothetical protein